MYACDLCGTMSQPDEDMSQWAVAGWYAFCPECWAADKNELERQITEQVAGEAMVDDYLEQQELQNWEHLQKYV